MNPSSKRTSKLSPSRLALLEMLLAEEGAASVPAPTIPRRKEANFCPLSFAQERLWFLDQLQPNNLAYNLPTALRLTGQFDVAAFGRSLRAIIQRHETLRTTFATEAGRPVQVIAPAQPLALPLIDLQYLAEAQREAVTLRLAGIEATIPFNLARGPLVRVTLVRLSEDTHVLLLTLHHIVADGWSVGVFTRELSTCYAAFAAGRPATLPALRIQYADYAIWQREWLQGAVLDAQIAYWRTQLADILLLELPTDRPRPAIPSADGAVHGFLIPAALSAAIAALSRPDGGTLFMVLLAAWQIVLARYSGQDDIVVGTPVANRAQGETEDLIGFLVNTLVLRTDLAGNPTFRDVLRRVRKVALDAYEHQDVPFEQVVEALHPTRSLSHHPLFQVMFDLQNASTAPLELPGLRLRPLAVAHQTAKMDLELSFAETAVGLFGTLTYRTSLFDAATITRMAGHLQTLLAGLSAHPAQPLAALPILSAAERQMLLVEWNATAHRYPEVCIHQLFEAQVPRAPDAVALVCGADHLTYRALNMRANALAQHLQSLGVGPEVRVGLCLGRSIDLVIGLLGILKAGGAFVPLDASYPPGRLAFILEDAGLPVLLTHQRLAAQLPPHAAQVVCLDAGWPAQLPMQAVNPVSAVRGEHAAYLIYTSGTTGRPKAVVVEHRQLVNTINASLEQFAFQADDVMPCLAAPAFDIALFELFPLLLRGGRLLLPSQHDLLDLPYLLGLLAHCTVFHAVPSLMQQIVQAIRAHADSHPTYAQLRLVLVGGERVPPALLPMLRQVFARAQLGVLYGPTEATIICTRYRVPRAGVGCGHPLGRPLVNVQARLYDRQRQLVPIGVPGELYIGGAGVTRGYLNRADLTNEKFVVVDGLRWYRSGDRARWLADGNLEFLDRIDQQVKVRGYRIELGEIEMLLGQHPTVRECVVVAGPAASGDTRLVAYVVAHLPQSLTVNELRPFLQAHLPTYMLPEVFVFLDALPLSQNGKVDRKALPAPNQTRPALEKGYIAPRTDLEQQLAGMWQDLVGIDAVGVHDNFFDLGGNSIQAAIFTNKLQDKASAVVSVVAVFDAPTVAELAAYLAERYPHVVAKLCPVHPLVQPGEQVEARALPAGPTLTPIPRLPRDGSISLPLSFGQQRLWFIDQLQPNRPTYNLPSAVRLSGRLDKVALQRSLSTITQRHETLRTTFATVAGQPVQVIAATRPVSLPCLDLRALPIDAREAAAAQLAQTEAQRPFDLARGPLLRAWLLCLGDSEHVVMLTMHHIIADAWSMSIFIDELVALYTGYTTGQPASLPELPIQYADYAAWQRDWLQGDVLHAQLAYWRQQLAEQTVLELPADHPRPAVATLQGAHRDIALAKALSDALAALSRREGVTLFMTTLAAFQVVLARYSGQDEIVVGTPISGRTRAETERSIGFFLNTLVLRTDLSGDPSFGEALRRIRAVCLGAYQHQDLPFEHIVEALQPTRDLSRHPLFQVLFSFQNAPVASRALADLRLQPLAVELRATHFDLSLSLSESQIGLSGMLEYSTDIFEATTIRRLIGHFQTLLEGIVADPLRRIAALPILSAVEQQQLLIEWNATTAAYPRDWCLQHVFEAQTSRTPDAVAVVFENVQLTYDMLNSRANQLARYLQTMGIGPELPVGLCLERSLELVVGLLAILKAGAVCLPLDPDYPPARLAFMLADAQAPVLLLQRHRLMRLRDAIAVTSPESSPAPTPHPSILCLDTGWAAWAHLRCENLDSAVQPANPAYAIYTSGSTGTPKGVLIPHDALVNYTLAVAAQFGLHARDRMLQFASLSFDVVVEELFPAWAAGAAVVLPEAGLLAPTAEFGRLLDQARITAVELPAAYWHAWVDDLARTGAAVPTALRLVLLGCEKPSPDRLIAWQRFGIPLIYVFGLTEATVTSTLHRAAPGSITRLDEADLPIGRPIANTQLYLLNRQMQPQPIGVPCELYIGGAGIARGYLNRPDLTAERFVPNPFATTNDERRTTNDERDSDSFVRRPSSVVRLYRTGDLARFRPDGAIEFLGRIDRQVKLRGYRVELGEIEAMLRRHPDVRECVVSVREDVAGDVRLVAYLVATKDERPTTNDAEREPAFVLRPSPFVQELRGFLQTRLPGYMVPAAFVQLNTVPLSPNGKIDWHALPPPDHQQHPQQGALAAPRTVIESLLVQAWAALLRTTQVGIHNNFFDLGGHSLLATQLISRVRDTLHVELPLRSLFEAPTIAGLAERIESIRHNATASYVPPLRSVPRAGALPLSFAQQRLWFLEQFQPYTPVYNVPTAVRLAGRLDRAAMQQCLTMIVERHEVLRTTFTLVDSLPMQLIAQAQAVPLPLLDLRALPAPEREARAIELATAEAQRPFDLARGPLLRVTLLRLGDDDYVLLLTMHHIVSDAWSMGVFVREMVTLYAALSNGNPAQLPELPIQYADYAAWQRAWLQGEELATQLAYWRQQLAELPLLDLPTDYPRPALPSFDGARHDFALPPALCLGIQALARQEGVTSFMALLAAWKLLLARYSNQDDIAIGTSIANRNRAEIEGLIGFFLNTVVLRTDVSGNPPFREILRRVREVCLSAYTHQDLPFEQIVETLQPERDLKRHPLFQIMFTLEHAPAESAAPAGLAMRQLAVTDVTARFDLTLSMVETEEVLAGTLVYSTALFSESTTARMLGHFQVLLAGIVAQPARPIADLPLLTQAERQQLLVDWNATQCIYPHDQCIHQLFEAQVCRTPDAVALAFDLRATEITGRTANNGSAFSLQLTYAELNARANQLAHELQRLGVAAEVPVGICVERSPEMMIGLLGVLKAGGAYLPLDPAYPPERLAFMLEDSRAAMLLVAAGDDRRRTADEGGARPSVIRRSSFAGQVVDLRADWPQIARRSAEAPASRVSAANLAYIIYTSGSTGLPKGVALAHQGVSNLAQAQISAFAVGPTSRVLQFASFSFDAAVSEIAITLLSGAALCLSPRADLLPGADLLQLLHTRAITHVTLPPPALAALATAALPGLQTIIVAGEACSPDLVTRWAAQRRFVNAYGPTEATVCATLAICPPDGRTPAIGHPIGNTQLYVLDGALRPQPIGVVGELYLGGAGLARGYLGQPERTAERFVPNPFMEMNDERRTTNDNDTADRPFVLRPSSFVRLYKTGDRVRYRADGALEYVGRIDGQVKVRGHRVEVGEVEAVLKRHAAVREAAVLARQDAAGTHSLIAYIVPEPARVIELWPSVAEYLVYDDLLYYAMTSDERRNASYRRAIESKVKDKVVVDIGTGKDAILARLCAEAGARKIYAIELLAESYEQAKACIRRLGLEDKILLIHGDATRVQLPEAVDVCVSEIVGAIGGSEGAACILSDARRFLRAGGTMIPERSITKIAAVTLPDAFLQLPSFTEVTGHYVTKIFDQVGYAFDLRVCLKGLTTADLISTSAVFEDLDFSGLTSSEYQLQIDLTITRDTRLDGFLMWLNLYTLPDELIDILEAEHCWLPVYFPVFYPGVAVAPGDRIQAVVTSTLCGDRLHPDYRLKGSLCKQTGAVLEFAYDSYHDKQSYRQTPFYRALFAEDTRSIRQPEYLARSATDFSAYLRTQLPEYMVPAAIAVVLALPLTPSGKIDRRALALASPARPTPDTVFVAPRTLIEELLAAIWADILGLDRVGIHDNFFSLGGHSLLATQVVARVHTTFQVELPLRRLFEAPTVARLAELIADAQRNRHELSIPPLLPVARDRRLPLSYAQQRLWFLDQLQPANSAYNLPTALRLVGPLDLAALAHSLSAIVERHEILRTTFALAGEQPIQVIAPPQPARLPLLDLLALPEQERAATARGLAAQEAERPFDLARGPLLRVILLRLGTDEHILLLNIHHIVADGWSVGVFTGELSSVYSAYRLGRFAPLPRLPIQYADYAIWQRDWLSGSVLDAYLSYWRRSLADVPLLELPTDRPRPLAQTFRGASQEFAFPAALRERLLALSRQAGVTLFMTLLAAFQTLLARYSSQDDIAVGTPIANRVRAETEGLIGFFVNTLVLRTDLKGLLAFQDVLRRVRETCLDAYAYQDLPFEQLVEALQPERDLGRNPLFQVMLEFQNLPTAPLKLPSLALEPLPSTHTTTKFDLTLSITEAQQGLFGGLEYSTDLFDSVTIARMIGHLQTLLERVVAHPAQPIATLPLLTVAERHQLLVEWNSTQASYPHSRCLPELFEAQAASAPDAAAVILEGQHVTYQELNHRANQLAHYLRGLGVGPDVRVGLCIAPSPELIVGLLGILKAGGVYIPLDPAHPQELLAYMLADSRMVALLTQSHLADSLPSAWISVICLDTEWSRIGEERAANPPRTIGPDNLAYVIYTSGSTGRPKGVMIAHRGLMNYLSWAIRAYAVADGAGAPLHSSIAFDLTITGLFAPLLVGRAVYLLPDVHNIEALNAMLHSGRDFSLVKLTPTHLELLSQQLASQQSTARINRLIVGGEPLAGAHVRFWKTYAPTIAMVNEYGPTETVVGCCVYQVSANREHLEPIPIGRPIANTQLYLLNRQMQPTPIGVVGEIYIGGLGIARGYLSQPGLTAERFVPNPFATTNDERRTTNDERDSDSFVHRPSSVVRLYRTGDLARYRADGALVFLGRRDEQVKLRGYRIELGEITAVLRQHPEVHEAVVVLRGDSASDKRLVAYVVPAETQNAERRTIPGPEGSSSAFRVLRSALAAELRAFLAERLPAYMLPSAVVVLAAMPLTPNGKLDRRALPAPNQDAGRAVERNDAPRSAIEDMLVPLWADVLQVAHVGIHDNFFALGGHSLLATRLISRVRETFAVELPLSDLFEAPTIAGLAAQIEEARRAGMALQAPPLLPAARDRPLPLSFAQQRLWFIDQLQPNSPIYNLPFALRLRGAPNLHALRQSLSEIVRRHEVLRTCFRLVDQQPVQVIMPALPLLLPLIDLRALPAAERETLARRLAAAEAHAPFDLAHGPLLRATLVRLDDQDHVSLLTMHHIIADGWSMSVLIREIGALYAALSSGVPSPLPELPIQYADYAVWQHAWVQGPVLAAQLAYWHRALADLPTLELPTDRARPAAPTYHGAGRSLALPASLSANLLALSRAEGVTLFMLLLAAFQTLLYRYTGQDDIAIGTDIANRNRAEIENLIGFFVNQLVLRTNLAGNPTFRELLRQVRTICLDAYTHQDLPFEQLVADIHPERHMNRTPLFQVKLILENVPVSTVALSNLTIAPIGGPRPMARFDLVLSLVEHAQGLAGTLIYSTELFDDTTIERLLGHFQTLLAGVVANPTRRLADLPVLTLVQQRQLLVEWNATSAPAPSEQCIHDLIAAQVARVPDSVALVFDAGPAKDERRTTNDTSEPSAFVLRPSSPMHLTYRELNTRADQLAHGLQVLGVGPEVVVAVCMERSIELIVALLGILKAGGAYLPLDPTYPAERLAFMLDDSQAPVLLTQASLIDTLPTSWAFVICLDTEWATIAQAAPAQLARGLEPANLAYVIYTSGSTGQPKGVQISQRNLVHSTWARRQTYHAPLDSLLLLSSVAFDSSVAAIFWTLFQGGTLILPPDGAQRDLPQLLQLFAQHRISHMLCLPALYRLLLETPAALVSLQCVIVAGEACPATLVAEHNARLPEIALYNEYGPTEGTVWSSVHRCSTADAATTVPIGRPIANAQLYVLDGQLHPLPPGVAGELYLSGAGLARGYLGHPDLTAERFVPNPFAPPEDEGRRADDEADARPVVPRPSSCVRLYKTGDLARFRPDGNIEFLGRVDQQVKLRGFRIELGEITAVLNEHPTIRESAVVVRGDAGLVAYVVPLADERRTPNAEGADSSFVVHPSSLANELRAFLQAKLPDYMVPAVVVLAAMPLTPSGKIDRRALHTLESTQIHSQETYVAPRNTLELQLVHIWEHLLAVRPISVTANFFDLGGHSLLAVGLMAHIQQHFGRQLSLSALFQMPTIEQIASLLRQHVDPAPASPLVAIQPGGSKPPLFLIHPSGGTVLCYVKLAQQLGLDQPCYGLQARGLEDEHEPHLSIEEMAAHYIEALRVVQPHGPYRLGGWSSGGIVAFEMAQQLHRQGQDVALLALLDTYAPASNGKANPADLDDAAIIVGIIGEQNLAMEYAAFQQLDPDEQLNYAIALGRKANVLPPDAGPAQFRQLLRVFRANMLAIQRYVPERYPNRITLFSANKSNENVDAPETAPSMHSDDQTLGWAALSVLPVTVYHTPGDHRQMLNEPHVHTLAEQLRRCIETSQAVEESEAV
jgi:amino acid adenylation domain-containing protein